MFAPFRRVGLAIREFAAFHLWAIVLLVCISGPIAEAKGNWEPVPTEELALKEEPKAPGAPAIILYRNVAIDDRRSVLSESSRIKVLTDAGTKYGDLQIPTAKWWKVDSIEARTVRPDGTSVAFTGAVRDVTVAKGRKYSIDVMSLTLPDVRPGTIIEYRYRVHWKAEYPSHKWEVQSDLFTRRAHFELTSKSEHTFSEPFCIQWVTRNLQQTPSSPHPDFFTLDVNDVPALETEDYTLPESELRSQVNFFYAYPPYNTPDSFWSRYAQYEGEELNNFIRNDKRIRDLVASIAPPTDPPDTRLRKAYTRAQAIRKISVYDLDTEEGRREHLHENKHVSDVIQRDYGDISDISALLVAMAREIGYHSGLVRVADRERGLFDRDLLATSQLTATLLWVERDGKFQILDPACEQCPFGLVSWGQSGASGIRTNYPGSVFVNVPANQPEDDVVERSGNLTLNPDGTLSGEIKVSFGGLDALELRNKHQKSDDTARKKAIIDRVKSWFPVSAEVNLKLLSNWNDIDKPIVADVAVSCPAFASVTRKRMLVPSWPLGLNEKDPFPHDRRKYAVVFDNPYQIKDTFTIAIPAGYQVESVPTGTHAGDAIVDFTFQVENKGSSIQISRQLVNRAIYVDTKLYNQLRFDYHTVKTTDEQQAILRQNVSASR